MSAQDINNTWGPAMLDACFIGNFAGVRSITKSSKSALDFQNATGSTPTLRLCKYGHREILHFVLTQGANADTTDNNGNAPLHFAAKCNYEQCVMLLLKHGVALNHRDGKGRTALW
jgi:ankyrin repeat protein